MSVGIRHSQDYIYAYKEESAYAAGNGTTVHEMDCFAAGEVANLSSMPFPNGTQTFPMLEYEWEKIRGASQGADTSIQWIKGIAYGDFTITHYVQDLGSNTYWLDKALQTLTAGSTPTSWVFHLETGENQSDIFGCVIKEYTLEVPEGNDWPKETINFMYYNVKDTDGGATVVTNLASSKPFLTGLPKIKKDMQLSLDGDSVSDYLKAFTLKVTIEYEDDRPAGRYERFDPYVKQRDVELTNVLLKADPSAQVRIPSSTAASLISIILSINAGTNTWTMTNFRCRKSNANEIPEFGLKDYMLEFENRGTCTYTKA